MSIATKTGDDGTTAILFGRRVAKTDLRIRANGAIDELNAALGMSRAFVLDPLVCIPLLQVQMELVTLMGELAVDPQDRERFAAKGYGVISGEMVDRLTALIHDLEKNHRISFQHWATPGASQGSACLDLARTVCRRAEREVLAAREAGVEVNPEIIRYLNRLSDLCWLYARWIETKAGWAVDPPAA